MLPILLALGCAGPTMSAQSARDSTKNFRWFALPVVYFTPETNWAFGAAGAFTFRWKGESTTSRPSQFQLGAAYTLENQLLFYLPYRLYWRDENWIAYGELGYYRYSYFFYGIGNDPARRGDEEFSVNFPRIRLNALRRMGNGTAYLGVRYIFDQYDVTETLPGGLFDRFDVPGAGGSLVSGLGLVFNFDSRNSQFYPDRGWFVESSLIWNARALGSDFDFQKFILDASHFLSLGGQHILGWNLYLENTFGNAPFNQLALLGGTRRLRGYYEGFYRDQHYISTQLEWRYPLFWRLSGTAFAATGLVAPSIERFSTHHLRSAAGIGLRVTLNKNDRINVRADYAFGKEVSGFYLTIGEAF